MNKNPFIFKKDNPNIEGVRTNLIAEVNQRMGALSIGGEDFKVEIKPFNGRSKNALAAYWCLIRSIVEWDKDNNGYNDKVWDEWFKVKARLGNNIDMMPVWKLSYKIKIEQGWEFFYWHDSDSWALRHPDRDNDDFEFKDGNYDITLGESNQYKTRSLSNKGDITKDEMQRLLMTVMEFGKDNEVPDCFIPDDELTRLLKFSRGFRDG